MGEVKDKEKLPEGWEVARLRDVVEKTLSGEWGIEPQFMKNAYPVIGTLSFKDDGKIDFSNFTLRTIFSKRLKCIKLRKRDILIEKSGGSVDKAAGRVVYVDRDFEGTCSNFVEIIRTKKKNNSKFVFYLLYYLYKIGLVSKYQQRTTGIINFKIKEYLNEYALLPPLPEQRKIAEILETVDSAIEKTDKIIEKYKRIKQGLMQDLLTRGIDENGQIRSEETHKFKDSPLGRIPEEWEVVELADVGRIITGSTPPTDINEYYGDEYEFISPEDITDRKYINKTAKMLSDLGFKISRHLPPKSVCVVCIGSTIGKVALTNSICTTNQQINTIIPNIEIYNSDAMYYFVLFYAQNPLIKDAGLQAVPIVNKGKFSRIQIPLAPLSEQHRISEILSQIDETIEKEQKYKEKLERIKKGLMEDLLTGKVRVNHLIKEGVEYVPQT